MKKKIRTSIPMGNKVRAELQKEIGSTCPFCQGEDVGHFEIHHIDENPSNNEKVNLILLCPTCHSKITKGDIAPVEVLEKKIELLTKPNSQRVKGHSLSFNKVTNAIIGDNNSVTIKQNKKIVKEKYPEGCVGHETLKANYIAHLIDRYNTYKEYELGKSGVNYAIFASHLKRHFKIGSTRSIYNLPSNKFEELVAFIQGKIDSTKLARIKGVGHKNYSSFEEYSA